MCILSGIEVNYQFRSQGIGKIIHELAEKIAEKLEYGCIICTDKNDNFIEKQILEGRDFKKAHEFINPRTDNMLNIHVKSLNQEEAHKRVFTKQDLE